ncbi:MAG: prolipoprotein diacylglyceryl transferase [Bacteroidales bacterium]
MLNYITWDIDPEIFNIGSLSIRWYGLMFAMAFLSGYLVFTKALNIKRLDAEMLDQLLIYVAIGVIAGARLGHCLFYEPSYYLSNPLEILKIWKGGLASHGAAIGILLAIWLYIKKHRLSFLWLMDRLVIVVPLAGAFIRTGNLFNSEIYGRATDVPWAFLFVRDKVIDPVTGSLLPNLPSHPTQIYEALSYLIIFAILFIFYMKKKDELRDGFIFGLFLILLFSARFFIEFIKNEQVSFEVGMFLNMGQMLSLPFILIGIGLIVYTKRKPSYFSKTPIPKKPKKKVEKK